MAKIIVLKPGKEVIVRRKARKNYICHECSHTIPKGVDYIEDNINYLTRTRYDKVFKKYYRNRICLLCWKGPVPK